MIQLANDYRESKDLSAVPMNKCLCKVANLHLEELAKNLTNKHNWVNCTYHLKGSDVDSDCMWNKPKEICGYKGKGFENYVWRKSGISGKTALEKWKRSKNHNTVILNLGGWKKMKWTGIGAAIGENHALIWLGNE